MDTSYNFNAHEAEKKKKLEQAKAWNFCYVADNVCSDKLAEAWFDEGWRACLMALYDNAGFVLPDPPQPKRRD